MPAHHAPGPAQGMITMHQPIALRIRPENEPLHPQLCDPDDTPEYQRALIPTPVPVPRHTQALTLPV